MKRLATIPAFNYAASAGLVPRGEMALYRSTAGRLLLRAVKSGRYSSQVWVMKLDRPEDVRAAVEEHGLLIEDMSALFRAAEDSGEKTDQFGAVARAMVRGA